MNVRHIWLFSMLAWASSGPLVGRAADATHTPTPRVVVRVALRNQAITPVTARYIGRGLREAESQHAQCLLIELDTPGGLLDSTRQIVSQIIAARVPVVVYVAPAGARAASAGLFVTLSAHVSAMAPATNIGAAHPVEIAGLPIGPQPSPPPAPNSPRKDETKHCKSSASLSGSSCCTC